MEADEAWKLAAVTGMQDMKEKLEKTEAEATAKKEEQDTEKEAVNEAVEKWPNIKATKIEEREEGAL